MTLRIRPLAPPETLGATVANRVRGSTAGRAAAELGIASVAIFSEDDAESLHTRKADAA